MALKPSQLTPHRDILRLVEIEALIDAALQAGNYAYSRRTREEPYQFPDGATYLDTVFRVEGDQLVDLPEWITDELAARYRAAGWDTVRFDEGAVELITSQQEA